MRSVLYTSHSLLTMPAQRRVVSDIVNHSRSWNRRCGITGALIFTGVYFSQYIEGPQQAVDDLVSNLFSDDRHASIDIITDCIASERVFPSWSLSYSGQGVELDDEIRQIRGRNKGNTLESAVIGKGWLYLLKEMSYATQTMI
jgi:hypothetical protein